MKTIKHIIISIILMHLWTDICYTQTITHNEIVRSALDEMFEDLDKSKVPTGFLLDYAVDLVEFERYNGMELNDSNYVTTPVFEEILLSLKSASVSTQPYDDVSYIMTDFTTSATDNKINVAYVCMVSCFSKFNTTHRNIVSQPFNCLSDLFIYNAISSYNRNSGEEI